MTEDLIYRTANFVLDLTALTDRLNKWITNTEREELSSFTKASLVIRVLLVGLKALELFIQVRGIPSSKLVPLKAVELIIRMGELPIRMFEAAEHYQSPLKILQEGFVIPFLHLGCASVESKLYSEKAYLEMSPEELKKFLRPIYQSKQDGELFLAGYKPINKEECRLLAGQYAKTAIKWLICQIIFKTGMIRIINHLYSRLFRQIGSRALSPLPTVSQQEDPFNLLACSSIPETMHGDIVFSHYICPLTLAPIRFPVGDPNGYTLYERATILEWLKRHHTSPVTRSPLTPEQLVPQSEITQLIEERLKWHSNHLRACAQTNAPSLYH
jgi:hypothetical protein